MKLQLQKTKKPFQSKSKQNKFIGTIDFKRHHSEGDIKLPYAYADSLFFSTSANFSLQLARISMVMAYAAFNTPNMQNGCENLENLLGLLDFKSFMSNEDYHKRPGVDTIGVGIGSKKVKSANGEFTLLYVGIRGGFYQNEWAGNFHVGESGNHEGFTISSNKVYDQILEYIRIFNITGKIKIWCSGFSRGAATCNMLGGKIADIICSSNSICPGVSLTLDDLYFYCFETPQGAVPTDNSTEHNIISYKYRGIHNIINPDDLVPRMGPSAMGFRRYGNDHILPHSSSDNYSEFLDKAYSYYSKIDSGPAYKVIQRYNGKFRFIKLTPFLSAPSASEFLDSAMADMSEIADYRTGMFKIEDEIMNFFVLINGYNKISAESLLRDLFTEIVKDADKIAIHIFTSDYKKLENTILSLLDKAFVKAGILTYDHEKARRFASTFGNFYWTYANKYPEDALNLTLNLFSFIVPHDPLLELSYLESLDIPLYEMKI